jgi:hypothetical protein
MIAQPGRAAVGLGVVLLGSPAYLIWRGASRSREVRPGTAEAER